MTSYFLYRPERNSRVEDTLSWVVDLDNIGSVVHFEADSWIVYMVGSSRAFA